MTKRNKGFTLLELLIAAALIGVLAMFATQAFRASSSEVRLEDAKARASLLFSAAQRYYIEHPGAAFFTKTTNDDEGILFADPDGTPCDLSSGVVQNLVSCGFLEYRQVGQETSAKNAEGEREFAGYMDMWFSFPSGNRNNMQVCLKGKAGSRILDRCTYCTSDGRTFSKQAGSCSEE